MKFHIPCIIYVLEISRITEKGDTDQVTKLQKEKRQLMEKVENLEGEYQELRRASEFIMSIIECMETEDPKKKVFEKRKKELTDLIEPPALFLIVS